MPRVNSRNPDKDPAAALGEHLRRVRLAAGYSTQEAFAPVVHISQDQVSRHETGNQPPMDDVFDLWMEKCGITGAELEMFKTMLRLARASKSSAGAGVSDFGRPWYEAEADAEFLHISATTIVPALFQTKEYAEAMHDLPGMDPDKAAEMIAFRMERQAILHGDEPVQVSSVLHESVLYLLMGSPAVMVRQLDHLLAMSVLPNVTLQVARGKGAYWGLAGPFQIASAHGKPDTLLMPAVEDQTRQDPALTRKAAILFEKIRGNALNVGDSRADLMEAREHWNSQQQQ